MHLRVTAVKHSLETIVQRALNGDHAMLRLLRRFALSTTYPSDVGYQARQMLQTNPQNANAHFLLAYSYHCFHRPLDFDKYIDDSLKVALQDENVYALTLSFERTRSLEHLQKAVDKNDPYALYLMGDYLESQQQQERAISLMKRAAALGEALALYRLSQLPGMPCDEYLFQAAINGNSQSEMIIMRKPKYAFVLALLGRIHGRGGNEKKALEHLPLVGRTPYWQLLFETMLALLKVEEMSKEDFCRLFQFITSKGGQKSLPTLWVEVLTYGLMEGYLSWAQVRNKDVIASDQLSLLIDSLIILNADAVLCEIGRQLFADYDQNGKLPPPCFKNVVNFLLRSQRLDEVEDFLRLYEAWFARILSNVELASPDFEANMKRLDQAVAADFPNAGRYQQQCYLIDTQRCIRLLNEDKGNPDNPLHKKLECYIKSRYQNVNQEIMRFYDDLGEKWFTAGQVNNLIRFERSFPVIRYWHGRDSESKATNVNGTQYSKPHRVLLSDALRYYQEVARAGFGQGYLRLAQCHESGRDEVFSHYYQPRTLISISILSAAQFYSLCILLENHESKYHREAIDALKRLSTDHPVACLYYGIHTGRFIGKVIAHYDIEQALDRDASAVTSEILSLVSMREYPLHVRIALLQLIHAKDSSAGLSSIGVTLIKEGVDITGVDLQRTADFLSYLTSYLHPDFMAKSALTLFDDTEIKLQVRAQILSTAGSLLDKASDHPCFPAIQHKLKLLSGEVLLVPPIVTSEPNIPTLIPSAPPIETTSAAPSLSVSTAPTIFPVDPPPLNFYPRLLALGVKDEEIPKKFFDCVTGRFMERPRRLSDDEVYDESTIPSLNGKSPVRQIPLDLRVVTIPYRLIDKMTTFFTQQQRRRAEQPTGNSVENHREIKEGSPPQPGSTDDPSRLYPNLSK